MLLILGLALGFNIGTAYYASLIAMKNKLWKMHNNLDEWIWMGIGDDIVKCREHRPEYEYYVKMIESDVHRKNNIPRNTVSQMREDLSKSVLTCGIYTYLLRLEIKQFFVKQ